MGVLRYFFSRACSYNVNKSALGILRKKTGYTLTNCRKALELHDNDTTKAIEWLEKQAKTLGWDAAEKLVNRETSHGLIGVAVNKKKVAMVEMNCETDFVSKNEKFKSVLELALTSCLNYTVLPDGVDTNSVFLSSDTLGKLKIGKDTLADQLAILIASIGENMVLRRAFCYETVRNDIDVAVSVHPPCSDSKILYGKYASFISFKRRDVTSNTTDNVENGICQHIIGMNPATIGVFQSDEELTESERRQIMIHQEYLFDDTKTIGELLLESGITILDFKRFECGEEKIQSQNSNEFKEQERNTAEV